MALLTANIIKVQYMSIACAYVYTKNESLLFEMSMLKVSHYCGVVEVIKTSRTVNNDVGVDLLEKLVLY